MLKKLFKAITLVLIMVLTLSVFTINVKAVDDPETVNEETVNDQGVELTDNSEETNTETSSDNTFKKGDVYLSGDNVTIDYIVDGNLFVLANSVTINSQIGGDAFILAKTINVGEQGYIFSNLFTCAQDIKVSGVVYDLYTLAQTVNIEGYIYRDIHVSTNTLNINGTIGRNAFANSTQINFPQNSDDNSEETQVASLKNYMLSLGGFVSTVVIIWLLCLWITPKFLSNTNDIISKKLLSVIGYGLLTPIVIAVAFVILLILGITSKIALLGLALLILLLAISSSIFVITINRLICQNLKIEKTIGIFGMLILSSIVLWAVGLIPYLGSVVNLITSITGLGIIITNIIPVREKKDKDTSNKTKSKKNID